MPTLVEDHNLRWLHWCRRMQAIAQDGLAYSRDHYDRERFESLHHLAAEILASNADISVDEGFELFRAQRGAATPKVDVRGAVFDGDKILLVRARREGVWSLPGGWATPGEPPSQALIREVEEESGLRVRVVKLVAVHDNDRHGLPSQVFQVYKLIMLAEIVEGSTAVSHETDGVAFFGRDELPRICEYRTGMDEIALCFEHKAKPSLPTAFD